MEISVIIPVYNAGRYVAEAVASALAQPETAEVLLVEDGSPDNALAECDRLARADARVRLLRHADGRNRGAAASRNLGIKAARFPFVAFLDADDYYLPGRFTRVRQVFDAEPDTEGVYSAVQVTFTDDAARDRWHRYASDTTHYSICQTIPPEAVFESIVTNRYGSFHTNGIVVRRSLFDRTGAFEPRLRMAQDTHLWIRLAALGRLRAGEIEQPVAVLRIHDANRVSGRPRWRRLRYQGLKWRSLIGWAGRAGLDDRQMVLLVHAYVREIQKACGWRPLAPVVRRCVLLRAACIWPGLVRQRLFLDAWLPGALLRRRPASMLVHRTVR